MTAEESAKRLISKAISLWMDQLQAYPGWMEWKQEQIGYTLNFDGNFLPPIIEHKEFSFSEKIAQEHAVVVAYMELVNITIALSEVEWYFRHYPFSNAPVSRGSHLRYCCELYFGRFYQFRERLKKLTKSLQAAVPEHGLDFSKFIKAFDKEFDQEIRARHGIHHHETFDEVAISRVTLLEITSAPDDEQSKKTHKALYRKVAKEWAARTQRRSVALDRFLEAVAEALLKVCPFLTVE